MFAERQCRAITCKMHLGVVGFRRTPAVAHGIGVVVTEMHYQCTCLPSGQVGDGCVITLLFTFRLHGLTVGRSHGIVLLFKHEKRRSASLNSTEYRLYTASILVFSVINVVRLIITVIYLNWLNQKKLR